MHIYIVCKKCKAKNSLKGIFPTRWELASEIGRQFQNKCKYCNDTSDYSVDEVAAKESYTAIFVSLLVLPIMILSIAIFWTYLTIPLKGGASILLVLTIIALVYFTIDNLQRKKVKIFYNSKPDRLTSIQFKRPLD